MALILTFLIIFGGSTAILALCALASRSFDRFRTEWICADEAAPTQALRPVPVQPRPQDAIVQPVPVLAPERIRRAG